MKQGKNVVALVSPIAERVAKELGYIVWDIDYVKEGTGWFLRIDIDLGTEMELDKECIDINDCERYSRAIDPILDDENPIEDAYTLEISSRELKEKLKPIFTWNILLAKL